MGWSASEMKCKKHPNQRQQPGVCSACLEEKLSQLSNSTSHINDSASYYFSSSLDYSPDSSSNYVSPNNWRRRNDHQRQGSLELMSSISLMISSGGNGLKKSRSMTFVRRNRVGDAANGKKKGGFWSKLIHSTGKRTKEVFTHSRTVRELKV